MADSNSRNIVIFDTTLRDGEQSPGASMNLSEKLEIAQALVDLGVDMIEAGFPIASPGDFEAVSRDRQSGSRGRRSAAWPAATDRGHRPRLGGAQACRESADSRLPGDQRDPSRVQAADDREEIIERAVAGVQRAAGYCDDIEFSPEDAARTEHDFLCQVVEAAIDAGATTVNIPDTVGYATPAHMGAVIRTLCNRVPNIDKAVISVHCHNDLGTGRRQQPGRRRGRRGPDRVHDQRHRRTGRQLLAGRNRDGAEDAARLLQAATPGRHPAAGSDQPAGLAHHGHAGAAQQGHRRPQRVCARSRHPSGRHAQGTDDLRDHAARRRRLHHDRPGAGQAQRPSGAGRRGSRSSAFT